MFYKLRSSLLITILSTQGIAFVSASVSVTTDSIKIAYGEDNRVETYDAAESLQRLAHSTAGMIKNIKLVPVKNHYIMPPATLSKEMRVCKGEKFSSQPSSVICSGFLVGKDLLVTAGHCILTKEDCESSSWVFDYKVNLDTKRADIMIPKSRVFKCKEVIESKLEVTAGNAQDYSLIKLDRVVEGRTPLKFRKRGKVRYAQKLNVIGHPSGLPQKITTGGKVFRNSNQGYFVTNLDTFGGNSGSAVFNATTNEVEGILVRGAKDYIEDPSLGCHIVNNEVEDISNRPDLGESVSRITNIKALMGKI